MFYICYCLNIQTSQEPLSGSKWGSIIYWYIFGTNEIISGVIHKPCGQFFWTFLTPPPFMDHSIKSGLCSKIDIWLTHPPPFNVQWPLKQKSHRFIWSFALCYFKIGPNLLITPHLKHQISTNSRSNSTHNTYHLIILVH